MENATKALIIAGAVLVSILLISIGILLINNNKGITNSATNLSEGMSNTATKATQNVTSQLQSL